MLTIASNVQSMFTARAVGMNTLNLQRSVERLSTGYRLNRAGDDAAGAAMVDAMTAEIRGLEKAEQNAQDGVSMAQTIDGGLTAIQENLQRIRELFVMGGNGSLGTDELDSLQREVNERVNTIDDIADAVTFNGQALLKAGTDKTIQTGAYNGETTTLNLAPSTGGGTPDNGIDIDITYVRAGTTADNGQLMQGTSTASLSLDGLQISGASVSSVDGSDVGGTIADLDAIIENISRMRGEVGAFQNALESKISFLSLHKESVTASRGRIRDVDVAAETANLTKAQILQQSAAAMLAQANSIPQTVMNLLP